MTANRDLDPARPAVGAAAGPPWIVAGIYMDRRDPADPGRVIRTEVDPADVRQWDDVARHLIQGHGGEPDGLTSHGLTLDQVRFAHADTHLALAFISTGPPGGHAHPGPLDAGGPTSRLASYFPFWSSPSSAAEDARDSIWFRAPAQTGLPHTGIYHVSFAELEDWAAGRLPRRLTSPTAEDDAQWAYWAGKLGVTEATRAEWIQANAGRALAGQHRFPRRPGQAGRRRCPARPRAFTAGTAPDQGATVMTAFVHDEFREVPVTDQAIRGDAG